MFFKKSLGKYDLKNALKPFASSSNHLLINYTKFKEAIIGKNSSSLTTIDLASMTSPGRPAGTTDMLPKFTVGDAVSGYEKFKDSTIGLDTYGKLIQDDL